MKKYVINLILLCVIISSAFVYSNAQSQDKGNLKKATNQMLLDIIRAKKSTSPFVILTPKDLSSLSLNEPSSLDPCVNPTPISIGEVREADISLFDCRLPDDSYADLYSFNGTQGQQIPIFMSSTQFDTYLGITNESGSFTIEDDNSGGGTNSGITATLPETGVYVILANTTFANQFGFYTISTSSAPQCLFSVNPTSAEVLPSGGSYTFQVNTQIGCRWLAFVPQGTSFISTTGTGIGPGTVTYLVDPNGPTTRTGTIRVHGQSFFPLPDAVFTVNQPPLICTYSLSAQSISVSAFEYTGSVNIIAPAGCYWSPQGNSYFVWTGGEGRGNGTINYVVTHNNGADRVGSFTVAGITFTVTQAGLNCTYSVSPTNFTVDRHRQTGTINVVTQTNCTWSIFANSWITMSFAGRGSGTANYLIYTNIYAVPRSEIVSFSVDGAAGSTYIRITQTAISTRNYTSDFDGDGKTDISIFRPSLGQWWYRKSSDEDVRAYTFGANTDKIVPADYTGDGKTDIAIFRPSTGFWLILRSEDSTFYGFPFGANGDIPAPGDYDDDSKFDVAVFRPSTATWYIIRSFVGNLTQQFGSPGDIPVVADYDGDNKTDLAIYRPSLGQWWLARSMDGVIRAYTFGTLNDKPVQGDYTGDGKADLAFFRPTTGEWFVLRSEDSSFYGFSFGTIGDIPSPGDYDGDRKFDAAVFRPSNLTWYLNRSTAGTGIVGFGASGDQPVPNAFVP
jgi:hypothetical protein